MPPFRVPLVALLVVAFFQVQSQDWLTSYQTAQKFYEQEQWEPALEAATRALAQYRANNGEANDNLASLLRLTSNICFAQDKIEEGLPYALDEIKIREKKKDLVLATAYSNVGQFYRQLSNYTKAIEYFNEGVLLLRQFMGTDEKSLLDEELNLAVTYFLADQNEKALSLFTSVRSRIKEEDISTLAAWTYFAQLKGDQGDEQGSLALLQETEKKFRSAQLDATQEYALLLISLADIFHRTQRYADAEKVYIQAQELLALLGLNDTDEFYSTVGARATNLQFLERSTDAEQLLSILQKNPSAGNDYATALMNSASFSQRNGNTKQALLQYQEALQRFNLSTKEGKVNRGECAERLALLLSELNKPVDAGKFIREAEEQFRTTLGAEHPRMAGLYNSWGTVEINNKNWDEGRGKFETALRLVTVSTPNAESVTALIGLGRYWQHQANFLKSDSLYTIALTYYDKNLLTPDRQFRNLVATFASSAQEQGQFNKAIALLEKGARLQLDFPSTTDRITHASLLENLANIHLRVGNLQIAKVNLDSAFQIYNTAQTKMSVTYASLLLSRGKYFQVMGDYPKAERSFREGLDLTRTIKGEQTREFAMASNEMALLYLTMGNYSEAEPLFKVILRIHENTSGKLNTEYATALQNLASLYQLQDDVTKAEPLLKEALEIDKQLVGPNHPRYALGLQNLAALYQKKKNFKEAASLMEQIKVQVEATLGKRHPSYATVISNLAALYQDLGQYAPAEKLWQESVSLRKQLLGEDHPDYARSLYGLAGVQFATQQWEPALQTFQQVILKYENQIASYFYALSEKEKSAFYSRIKPVFESYQDFCVQMIAQNRHVAELTTHLLDLQLSTKAILLTSSNKVRTNIQASGDRALLELFTQWQESKENIVRCYSYSQEERARLNIHVKDLEQHANDLEKKLSEKSSLFESVVAQKKITWKDVQQRLGENETAVEIIRIRKKFAADSVYYVALVTNKTDPLPQLVIWPLGAKLETRAFRYHRNAIRFHLPDTTSFDNFWKPLAVKLPPGQTLFVSCDGVFNKINFNSVQDHRTKKWVLDDYTIRLLTNTSELVDDRPSKVNNNTTASIFGYADFNLAETDKASHNAKRASGYGFEGEEIPMLPATEKEVFTLEKTMKENSWAVQSYMRNLATEANLKSVRSPGVLHIATHGFFMSDLALEDQLAGEEESLLVQNPLFRSGLLLAGASLKQEAGQEDGVLTAYEAMNLNLDHTDLVSLSACETGLGEVKNGEGVYGLQRAFLVAGARTVIMSLWQVDDAATQELMGSFFKAWIGGATKFEAFRHAQLELKEKYQQPYYWGAFVIIGN